MKSNQTTNHAIALIAVLLIASPCMALRADCNSDGRVDFLDLAIMSEEWLMDAYGTELAGGTFDEDLSGWNPVIFEWGGSGVATCESSSPETATLTKTLAITEGTTYHVSWDIDRSSGASEWTLTIILGGTEYAAGVITAGSFSTDIVAGGDDLDLVIELHTADAGPQWASLDNISVKEVVAGIWNPAAASLKTLISESPSFQAAVGAADADAAKASIFISAYTPDETEGFDRPFVLISRFGGDRRGRSSIASGQLKVLFEREIPSAYRADNQQENAELEFSNVWETIVDECMTLSQSAGYLLIRDWDVVDGPFRYATDELKNVFGTWNQIAWGLSD